VLFQPHRYSRTQHLWDDFRRAFNQADILALLDIYAASEAPIPGVTSEALASAITEAGHKNVHYFRSMQEGIEYLLKQARPGDAILTIVRATSAGRAMNSWFCWKRSIQRLMHIRDPKIIAGLAELNAELQHGASLANMTSLGIGGTTDLVRIRKHECLPGLLNLLDANDIQYKFLGGRFESPRRRWRVALGSPPACPSRTRCSVRWQPCPC